RALPPGAGPAWCQFRVQLTVWLAPVIPFVRLARSWRSRAQDRAHTVGNSWSPHWPPAWRPLAGEPNHWSEGSPGLPRWPADTYPRTQDSTSRMPSGLYASAHTPVLAL